MRNASRSDFRETKACLLSTSRAVKMLRSGADADEAGGNLSQNWKPFQQTKHDRQRIFAMRGLASNHAAMNEDLHSLDKARRPFAARLHFTQIVHGNRAVPQFFREKICGRDGILNGEIDPDAAGR